MINKKMVKGLLFGSSLITSLTLLNTEKVTAEGLDTKPSTLVQNQDISPIIKLDNVVKEKNDAKFSDEFISKAYIKTDFTMYHENPNEKVLNTKALNVLPTGSYADVEKVEQFSDGTYVLLSVFGREVGWVTEDSLEYVSYAEVENTQKIDSEKTYGVINKDQVAFDKPKELLDSKITKETLAKDTQVTLVEDVQTNIKNSYDSWYLYKSVDNEGYINISDLKDLNLYGKENISALLKTENVNVYKSPTHDSDVVLQLKDKESKVDLFAKEIEKIPNKNEYWVKVSKDNKEMFVPKSTLEYIDYATEKESKELNTLAYISEQTELLSEPTGYKSSVSNGSIDKDSLIKVVKQKTVTFKGQESTWALISQEGKELGYVPIEKTRSIASNEEVLYTLDDNDSKESILSEFNLAEKDFYYMNLTLADTELSEGTTVRLQQNPIVYDVSKVSGSDSGIQLVNEMLPSVESIKDSGLKPSVAFAQAIHESGGGTSKLAKDSNNLFGIKGTYKGQGSSWSTWEDYGSGSVTINATFRSYPSKVESILDYVDLITTSSRYTGAINASSPYEAVAAIKNGGYATDPLYISKVMNVIDTYDLTQFDN